MRMRTACSIMVLLAAPAALAAQETVRLRLSGRPGSSNRYVTTMEVFIRGGPMASMMSSDTTMPMTRITMFATRTLTAVTGDTLTFSELVDSARFESPAMPQMAQMAGPMALAAINGSTTVTRMDASGQIFDVQTTPGSGGAPMGMSQGGQGGRGGMGGMMSGSGSRIMFGFPDRAVRVGEAWTESDTVTAEGVSTSVVGNYRLERIDNQGGSRIAVVSLLGTMNISSPGGPMNMTSTGEIFVDLTNSRLTSMVMNISGVMSSPQMGGDMPMKMIMTQRLM